MEPLETIGAAGVIFKAKYVKRTGGPGNYKYWYRNPKTGKLQAGKQPAKKPTKESTDHILTRRSVYTGREIKPSKKPKGSQGVVGSWDSLASIAKENEDKKKEAMVKLRKESLTKIKVLRIERAKAGNALKKKLDYFRKQFDDQRASIHKSEQVQIDAYDKEMDKLDNSYFDKRDALDADIANKEAKIKQKYPIGE